MPSLKAVEIFKELRKLNLPKDITIFDLSSSKIIHSEIKTFSKDFKKCCFMSSNCWFRKIWN